MKRILALLCLCALLFCLAGCAQKVPCDLCGKTDVCTTVDYLGYDMKLCNSCYSRLVKK